MLAKWGSESELSEELIVVQLGGGGGLLGKSRKEVKGRCV